MHSQNWREWFEFLHTFCWYLDLYHIFLLLDKYKILILWAFIFEKEAFYFLGARIEKFKIPYSHFCKAFNLTYFGVSRLHFKSKFPICMTFGHLPGFNQIWRNTTSPKRHFLKKSSRRIFRKFCWKTNWYRIRYSTFHVDIFLPFKLSRKSGVGRGYPRPVVGVSRSGN